ncbi:MAG: LytTR family DNA-binding domain-containing protein [Saprospiraceae bacterium]|nr:LytTR family DNA-binding domain-containing protein [Saprospiraceae bacterium]
MKILILEDEIPAYEKLKGFILSEIPKAEIVGWGRSNQEAQTLLATHQEIDLIFSDIELLDGPSFEAFEAVKVHCPIIFCTGFDKYVLKAFQSNGIAYLLKPYSVEQFREAHQKYLTLFKPNTEPSISSPILSELKQILAADKRSYRRRFTVKKKDGIKLLATEKIISFEANGDFCRAIDNRGEKHTINHSLSEIDGSINPNDFFRINRSQIINIDFIEKIEGHAKNKLCIKMLGLPELFFTSSSKTPEFRKWLER